MEILIHLNYLFFVKLMVCIEYWKRLGLFTDYILSVIYLSLATFGYSYQISSPRFISQIDQIGAAGEVSFNEELLSSLGVPGYSDHPYNILKFGTFRSDLESSATATAAFCWQHLAVYITNSTLRHTLTGKLHPTCNELRAAIKSIYAAHGIKLFISAGGGYSTTSDQPQRDWYDIHDISLSLAHDTIDYLYDGVDINWLEPLYFNANGDGESWLIRFTSLLHDTLSHETTSYYITHSPLAQYFMGSTNNQYPRGAYLSVHEHVGSLIDWYNIQFYNQGTTIYNTFATMFNQSVGWGLNSAVYQIIKGDNPENVSVPAEKIVIGKPATNHDVNGYLNPETLTTIFNQAVSVTNDSKSAWNTGFMIDAFYNENHQTPQFAVGNQVITANWWINIPTEMPTDAPTNVPTDVITNTPTNALTNVPTNTPTNTPIFLPTNSPTNSPTDQPENAAEAYIVNETGTNDVKTVKEGIPDKVAAFVILAICVLVLICCLFGIGAYIYGCCKKSTHGEDEIAPITHLPIPTDIDVQTDIDVKII